MKHNFDSYRSNYSSLKSTHNSLSSQLTQLNNSIRNNNSNLNSLNNQISQATESHRASHGEYLNTFEQLYNTTTSNIITAKNIESTKKDIEHLQEVSENTKQEKLHLQEKVEILRQKTIEVKNKEHEYSEHFSQLNAKYSEKLELSLKIDDILSNFTYTDSHSNNLAMNDIFDNEFSDSIKSAITSHSIEEFDRLITKISNINFIDKNGQTIIMHTAICGFNYGIHYLIQMDADINIIDNYGCNLLLYITNNTNIDIDDLNYIFSKTKELYLKDPSNGNIAIHNLIESFHNLLNDQSSELTLEQKETYINQVGSSINNYFKNIFILNNEDEYPTDLAQKYDLKIFEESLYYDSYDNIDY